MSPTAAMPTPHLTGAWQLQMGSGVIATDRYLLNAGAQRMQVPCTYAVFRISEMHGRGILPRTRLDAGSLQLSVQLHYLLLAPICRSQVVQLTCKAHKAVYGCSQLQCNCRGSMTASHSIVPFPVEHQALSASPLQQFNPQAAFSRRGPVCLPSMAGGPSADGMARL